MDNFNNQKNSKGKVRKVIKISLFILHICVTIALAILLFFATSRVSINTSLNLVGFITRIFQLF